MQIATRWPVPGEWPAADGGVRARRDVREVVLPRPTSRGDVDQARGSRVVRSRAREVADGHEVFIDVAEPQVDVALGLTSLRGKPPIGRVATHDVAVSVRDCLEKTAPCRVEEAQASLRWIDDVE